jgi:hypothetical protein
MLLSLSSEIHGQLGNMWTQQVGIEGTLTSGALLAAERNNAGIYYNPASLSSDSIGSLAINTAALRSQFLWYKNAFGPNTQMNRSTASFESPFLSVMIPSKNKLGFKIGAATFSRYNVNYNIFERIVVRNPFPELDHFKGDYEGVFQYSVRSQEQWILFSTSRKINEKFAFGASYILAVRSFDYKLEERTKYTFIETSDAPTISSEFNNATIANLSDFKGILKLGAIFEVEPGLRLGFSLTTPSFSILSFARNYRTLNQTNISDLFDDSANPSYDDFVISNNYDKLKGHFKTPFSVAFGISYDRPKSTWSFAAEYYHAIARYPLIDGADYTDNLINTTVNFNNTTFLDLVYAQRSIINFAIGYGGYLKKNLMLLAGFRTNFSTTNKLNSPVEDQFLKVFDLGINQLHVSGGLSFNFKNNHFTLGADLGFNYSANDVVIINFSNPELINSQGIPLRGEIEPIMTTTALGLGVILGYSLSF